ncbi:MAG: putative 2-aminoethylphosphonate ABC transporter ATP-binding protein [Caldilineaceae bacterium]
MQETTPYLQVERLSRFYGRTAALDNVSLQIYPGEFVFLLGPSGCGKTTLLRLIAGLDMPSAGAILQGGEDVTRFPPSRRDFGIVFQSYALFPNLTVAQNIAYGLQSQRRKASSIDQKVHELLALVGLQGYERRYPSQLSGGQQQRVALARALAIEPGLLLLDEPLSALDARVRAGLRLEIAALQRRLGITTIMVTHDQEEALTMADRIVVMDKGRVVQCGARLEIYQNPATPFVADFVGIMNFLPAVVTGEANAQVRCGTENLLIAPWHENFAPGAEVTLAIRPEELEIAQDAVPVSNTITAHVHALEFTGPLFRMHVHLPFTGKAGQPVQMTAYVPLSARMADQVRVGHRVPLYLPPHALRIFSANGHNGYSHGS